LKSQENKEKIAIALNGIKECLNNNTAGFLTPICYCKTLIINNKITNFSYDSN
jgi:hypothetical protein